MHAGKETRTAMIARPRQKQELKLLIDETQEKFTTLNTEILELENSLQDVDRDHQRNLQDEQKGNIALQQNQKLVNQCNLDFEKVRQRKQWVENQQKTLEQQLSSSHQSEASTKDLLTQIGNQIESQRKEVDALRSRLNAIPIDDIQSSVGHWKTNLAVVERASNEAEKRLQENRLNNDQNRQRYKSIHRRIEDFKDALLEIEDERAIKKARETEFKEEIEKIREDILPAENELKNLEKSFDKLQEEISSAQQTVTIGERYVTQGQLDYSRNKDVLENLRRRIEEDFGLVSFEYSSSISGPNPLPFDGLVEQLPIVTEIEPNLEENINRQRAQMRRIGPINPEA